MTDLEKLQSDMRVMLQDIGDSIADALDQMLKGKWTDDHGHDVRLNASMMCLKDILAAMTHYRSKNSWTLEHVAARNAQREEADNG